MGEKRNFAALDWVIGEISDTLKDARQALEAYVEDPKDSTRIRFCLTHIHQVHGSLQMVEFHGASLLAEEMEQLAQALMDNQVTSAPEAQEVLMRSLLQLPSYLDHVRAQKEDNPGIVLPLLNDLRAVRNQSYLSETNLFSPDLRMIKEVVGARHPITQDKTKLAQVLKKLREMYQFAAASVLRGIKVDENLNYLDKVFSRMEALTMGTACYPVWEVSAALVEGLLRDDIELSVAVRGLLRHLARELRVLGEKSPSALDFLPRESLLKNLLYYVAKADSGGKKVNRVKQRYNLAQALLDGVVIGDDDKDSLSAPDPDAIRSVIVALNDEINSIKHALDLSLSGHGSPEDLKEVLPIVKRVADTLAVLGIGDLRKQVNMQTDVLTELSKQNSFDEAKLLDVAGKIIEIEHRLEAIAKVVGTNRDLSTVNEREIEIDSAKVTVVKECQHGLEQAKDAIVEYISSKWDKSHLLNVGSLLHNIRGGLEMIPLARPAHILEACAAYIQEQLLDQDLQPSWQSLDTLADAIASVEYYLERLLGDMEEDTEALLEVAESSMASLGYPVSGERTKPTLEAVPASPAPVREPQIAEPEDVGEPSVMAEPVVGEHLSPAFEPPASEPEPEPVVASVPEPEPEPEPEVVAPAVSLDQISVDEDGDEGEESDIDDEIIEIFIEEAGEVRETLDEYFPQWKNNPQDQDALVVVRRAFHTLKGSGRMVEAFDIGELAWSIENMLNRVIDRTVKFQPACTHIIDLALNLLPELVKAFANKRKNPHKALSEQYMAWAHSLSEGQVPAELAAIPDGESVPLPDLSAAAKPAAKPQATVTPIAEPPPVAEVVSEEDDSDDEQQVLWDIFSSEARTHLKTMDAFIRQMEQEAPLYSPPSDDLQRALHTLKGSAKMAQVTPLAAMAEPLEAFAKELISYQVDINADILQLYRDAVAYTREGLAQIEARQEVVIPRIDQFIARAAELRELAVGHLIRLKEMEKDGQQKVDPRLLSIFMAEEMNLLLDAEQILKNWQSGGTDDGQVKSMVKELTTLEAGAQQANLPDMAGLSNQLRTLYEQTEAGQQETNDDFFAILIAGHNALLDMVDAVAAGQNVNPPSEEITSALASLIHNGSLLPALHPQSDTGLDDLPVDFLQEDSEPAGSATADSGEQESRGDYTLPGSALGSAANETDFSLDEEDQALFEQSLEEPDYGEQALEDQPLAFVAEETLAETDLGELPLPEAELEEDDDHEHLDFGPEGTWLADDSSGDDNSEFELIEEPEDGQPEFSAHDAEEDLSAATHELEDYVEHHPVEHHPVEHHPAAAGDETAPANDSEDLDVSAHTQNTADIAPGTATGEDADTTRLEQESDPLSAELLAAEAFSGVETLLPEPAEEPSTDLGAGESLAFEGLIDDDQPGEELPGGEILGELHVEALHDDELLDGGLLEEELFEENLEEGFDEALEESLHEHELLGDAPELLTDETLVEEELLDEELLDLSAYGSEPLLPEEESLPLVEDFDDIESPFVSESRTSETAEAETPETVIPELEIPESEIAETETPTAAEIPATDVPAPSPAGAIPGLLDTIDVTDEDYDPDILEVFLEEAEELIEELDEAVHAWESDWSDLEQPEQIKRALHTLKGGARLSGMGNLGELTHDYESFLIASDVTDVDDSFFGTLHKYQDRVLHGVRAIQAFLASGETSAAATADVNGPAPAAAASAAESEVPAEKTPSAAQDSSNVLPFAPKLREPEAPGEFSMPSVKPAGGGGGQQMAMRKQAGPQEVVKVSSDLLEELVNLAGETSISRARIEQQVNDFGQALDDIDATLHRLQEQLRRLDIETEAQVLFRQEQLGAHEEFDPLEMDRYSQLQQLSRSLIESASDLVDLRQTLNDNIRDTETLLLQQSRINTTLQEGLMRSRMVPFSRLVPRLRRIVRQVAGELGKNVSFELDNIEGELDRSVLERMVPPLEHMLRNAVDHGIELPDQRIEAGKPETGRIVLTLGREGGDVLLRLADDGRGVNLRRVREKAIERGLMSSDSELSDFDIMQFILHAGFSTAETVTQISGRGVGMDVVSSEIKAMGGSVVINSNWGKGTEIVVRLPFTVSVNRALMVEVGLDLYAIPLNTIEGIVRVSPFELEHYYTSEEARFEYAGENYQVRYLGTMLNADIRPQLEGHALPLPVLLVRSADKTMALQVDNLLGSREVVVKSLGSQFSAVQGLSGATLMGDGSVVVIIDPHALVRKEMARAIIDLQPTESLPPVEAPVDVTKTVMVVDDSVTVRKVTTRFLEREGFNVITAKDGVDALRILQDEIPDLMLLDIEMPRMDGFEVAANIRNTSRWRDIPIIMITSRTGEKHRERAMSLGVNKYMGKPYQEDRLLEGIGELLAEAEQKAKG